MTMQNPERVVTKQDLKDFYDGIYPYLGGGGGSSTLSGLTDTDISTPSDGQVLTYDSAAGKWENANASGGADDLNDLGDVVLTTPSNGQVLKYDSATSKWINGSGGGVNYSTTEQAIGTWIDGNTIFQKTYVLSGILNEKSVTLAHGLNLDTVVKIDAITKRSSSSPIAYMMPFNYLDSSGSAVSVSNNFCMVGVNATDILVRRGEDVYGDDIVYVTIQYTKAT